MSGSLTRLSIWTRKWEKLKNVPGLSDGLYSWLAYGQRMRKIFFSFISKIFSRLLTSWVKCGGQGSIPYGKHLHNIILKHLHILYIGPFTWSKHTASSYLGNFSHCVDPTLLIEEQFERHPLKCFQAMPGRRRKILWRNEIKCHSSCKLLRRMA